MRYSLDKYQITFKSKDSTIDNIIGTVTIGGEGSTVGQISVSRTDSLWSTEGFATGGWVHNKNLSRRGTISVQLSQLSNIIPKLINLCNVYQSSDRDGLTISVKAANGKEVANGIDCYPNFTEQSFGTSASTQNWSFTCGEVNFI